MVLIVSDNFDRTTNLVIDWLIHYNVPWIRINEDDQISLKSIEFKNSKIEKFEIQVNNEILDLETVSAYWFRRGYLNWDKYIENPVLNEFSGLRNHLKLEIGNLDRFIHSYLNERCRTVNSCLTATNDKTYYTYLAAKCGLEIPNSVISGDFSELEKFFNANQQQGIITKAINESLGVQFGNFIATGGTSFVREMEYENNDSAKFIFPSLLQSYVDKLLELRIFYFIGECYAMAIFSQNNEQTKIDFRNYDKEKPNRNVPFKLPIEISDKIRTFMETIELNCGSIDMILTSDNRYIFLEVNPVGQFGMVSFPCNYQLEKRIANYLSYE